MRYDTIYIRSTATEISSVVIDPLIPQGVYISTKHFKFIRVQSPTLNIYQCLLGCPEKRDKNGNIKYLTCALNSRHNLKRHVEVSIFFAGRNYNYMDISLLETTQFAKGRVY